MEQKGKKILVLNYEYPPVGGGGGAACRLICAELARKGYQVRVQTSRVRGLPPVAVEDGVRVYRGFCFRRYADRCSVLEMAFFLIGNLPHALRHALFWKPDLIHVHFAVPTGVLAWITHKLTRVPYVLTTHLGDVPGALPEQTDHLFRLIQPLTRPIWRNASAITAVSDFVRELGEKAYGRPVTTIFNGLEPVAPKAPPESPPPTRFVFAGRFNPQKNLVFLLRIMAHLTQWDWNLTLIGDGPERAALVSAIENLQLNQRVKLTGWETPEMVDIGIANSHVLLLPSRSEGLPMVGLRALAFGLAIMGSDIGGLRDVVEHGGNGFLVALDDRAAWTDAFRRLLTSPGKLAAFGTRSLAMAQRFRIEHVVAEYEAIFDPVMERGIRENPPPRQA